MKLILSFLLALSFSLAAQAQSVTLRPAPEGGLSIARYLNLNETKSEVKATAGKLYGYYLFNSSGGVRYFKFYDAPSAAVTVGTTAPVVTIAVPAGAAANVEFAMGVAFVSGITAVCVTGVDDSSTTGAGANECVANFFFK
jgi:hypothetical protein